MEHEPRRLLGNAERAMKFPRRDPVFAVQKHPDRREPLFQRNRRVLKDRAGLQREGRLVMARVALPHAARFKPANILRPAMGAGDVTIGPAKLDHKGLAMSEISEVKDRVSKGSMCAHETDHTP